LVSSLLDFFAIWCDTDYFVLRCDILLINHSRMHHGSLVPFLYHRKGSPAIRIKIPSHTYACTHTHTQLDSLLIEISGKRNVNEFSLILEIFSWCLDNVQWKYLPSFLFYLKVSPSNFIEVSRFEPMKMLIHALIS